MQKLHPDLALGPVVLRARALADLGAWYRDRLGMAELARSERACVLGASDGTPLVVLTDAAGSPAPARREPGLYHVALLLPSRADLGRFIDHAARTQLPLLGASDHLVSEALYLTDPEGNGIEIYRDRERRDWPLVDGRVHMDNSPFDVAGVVASAPAGASWTGMPAGTTVGHVHLKVADLAQTRGFYEGRLGFDVTEEGYRGALFVSAGGYHHHFGLNTWESAGGRRNDAAAGLGAVIVALPGTAATNLADRLAAEGLAVERSGSLASVDDPSGNRLVLAPAGLSVEALISGLAA